ncbi:rhamnan synthesis F family protein [Acidisphaera sp. L21]|uniref:rhamnan synthesis F family protein n=1 Tax=Acidisphaera sp. L21 TaxID=1641851 RepID=UPI00131D231D|nr:rhamnan synthesis F family protein [Acidisphaera sp. L21]
MHIATVRAPLASHAMEFGPLSPVVDRPDRRMHFNIRLRNYLTRVRYRGSLLTAAATLTREWVTAKAADLAERWRGEPRITQILTGEDVLEGAPLVAMYVHYAPVPDVSAMVLGQLRAYRALGFRIVFVSMAPRLPQSALAELLPLVARVVMRRNTGLDFGAWQDMLPLLNLGALTELLLVNDSVCGPFLPLEPVFGLMRHAGDGLFGLTENLAPRPHLQSYLLLARGAAAIADIGLFLRRYRQTAHKRAVVRHGEIALTGWMRRRGHMVAACFGYEAVEQEALQTARALQRLARMFPRLFPDGVTDAATMRKALHHYPLNPAHSLWFELIESCGFPFLKTELLLRNPIRIPDLSSWRMMVPPLRLAMVEAHLRAMAGRTDKSSAEP